MLYACYLMISFILQACEGLSASSLLTDPVVTLLQVALLMQTSRGGWSLSRPGPVDRRRLLWANMSLPPQGTREGHLMPWVRH